MFFISKLNKISFFITSITLLFIIFSGCILYPCVITLKMNKGDVCLANYATTHTILRDKIYFLDLTLTNVNVSTTSSIEKLIEGSKRANIMLQTEGIIF